jgi:pyruvate dehydrogenase E1 component alpha subunit
MAKDPIVLYHLRLLDEGASEEQLVKIETEVADEVNQATEEAKLGPIPGEDLLMKDVWADGGSKWRN